MVLGVTWQDYTNCQNSGESSSNGFLPVKLDFTSLFTIKQRAGTYPLLLGKPQN